MAEPSRKSEKGLRPEDRPLYGQEDPAAAEPEAELGWETEAFDLPPALPPTEHFIPVKEPARAAAAGDNSPTVISRTPVRGTAHDDGTGHSLRGRRLAHFELIAPIGVGGMAAVIKGRDLQLDRTVALKVLPPDMAADPENIRRFHQEARAAAKLDHENIARVFFCGEDQKLHFIAFEFVQGDNLRTILERRGRLPVGEALNYILQVATGLAHASSRGVVHRDIKPSNIIITPNGRAKLVDMGLARSTFPQDDHGLTHSGVTLGTFDYISPEQALEPREADVRSDIYSLGCTVYHMLTGQPPVPEGTAAKKLHCHQHEAPVDPRQLNPEVPDEVAAILARMMAKQPRDRYQRPEQLVQHLLRVAQKLDAGSGRADGVLFVDAPLPAAPARPLFLTALAVAAVIALVFLLQSTSPAPAPPPFPPPHRLEAKVPGDEPPTKDTASAIKPPRDPDTQAVIPPGTAAKPHSLTFTGDLKELRAFAAQSDAKAPSEVELVLAEDLFVGYSDSDKSLTEGLSLQGKKITIRSDPGGGKRTIWLKYAGDKPSSVLTALSLRAEQAVLKGIRFVLSAGSVVPMTGVHFLGGKNHTLEDCQFIQTNPSYQDKTPLCSVLLEQRGSPVPSLFLQKCAFVGAGNGEVPGPTDNQPEKKFVLGTIGRGGQDAITRRGEGAVRAEQCVFGPHLSCFRFEGPSTFREPDVVVEHCSALLADESSVFRLTGNARCRLDVKFCLFARGRSADADNTPEKSALLVRQEDGRSYPLALQYNGRDNRYHNLDGFWVNLPDGQVATADWKDFVDRVHAASGTEQQSQLLEIPPWKDLNPTAALQQLRLADAFRVRTAIGVLRVTGLVDEHLIGAEFCAGVNYTEGLAGVREKGPPPPLVRNEKVVNPATRGGDSGVFRTLSQALEDVQPGDVILIQHNGLLPVKPVTLEKGGVTIKAARGFRPVLTLDTTIEREAALFRIHDGKVKFQNLDFRLDPGQKGFDSRAVATVLGDGSCTFEGCVITLAEPLGCQLAAVILADPTALRPARSERMPILAFERCLVRGNGDLVWCRSSRPFRLEASNSLAVLGGSILSVEPGKQEGGDAKAVVDFRQVTAVVAGPLLQLRPSNKDLKGIVALSWKPTGCLFASIGSKSLVYVAGVEAGETALQEKLTWKGSNNAYNFLELIDQQPSGGMMRPQPYNREKWKAFTGETDGKFVEMVKFADSPDPDNLALARAEQFAVASPEGYGASVDKLPVPAPPGKPDRK